MEKTHKIANNLFIIAFLFLKKQIIQKSKQLINKQQINKNKLKNVTSFYTDDLKNYLC